MAAADDDRLNQAVKAFRQGNRRKARQLICAVLDDDPRNLAAWGWACEVATTPKERVHCLEQMLAIDPAHEAARRRLAQLRDEVPADEEGRRPNIVTLLLAPFSWFLNVTPAALLLVLLALAGLGAFVYFRVNTDLYGLLAPDFDALTISDSYEQITADDVSWTIAYESAGVSEYAGTVRHASPVREAKLSIVTHDVLVTSGDYADPAVVSTSVINHHFRWRSRGSARPDGRINLLHTVPRNEEIYRQLLTLQTWDRVVITGQEIKDIKVYDADGVYLGKWRDTGCNTLLVESVSVE